MRFRNLAEPGGPQFPEASVKALAIGWPNKISGELDDQGNPIDRLPGLADPILGPFKNDKQARAAQNGALPPDLSLIAKARSLESTAPWYTHWFWMLVDIARGYQEGGPDYIHDLLTGYTDPPAGVQVADGMYYNVTFPGHQLAMPPPLVEGQRRRVPARCRRQGLARPERARHRRFPRLVGRPEPQLAQAHRLAGAALPARHDARPLRGQAARLERREALVRVNVRCDANVTEDRRRGAGFSLFAHGAPCHTRPARGDERGTRERTRAS